MREVPAHGVPALLPDALDFLLEELAQAEDWNAMLDLLEKNPALAQILFTIAKRHDG